MTDRTAETSLHLQALHQAACSVEVMEPACPLLGETHLQIYKQTPTQLTLRFPVPPAEN